MKRILLMLSICSLLQACSSTKPKLTNPNDNTPLSNEVKLDKMIKNMYLQGFSFSTIVVKKEGQLYRCEDNSIAVNCKKIDKETGLELNVLF